MKAWRLRVFVASGLLAVIALVVVLFRVPLLGVAIGMGGRAAGYTIGYERLALGGGHLEVARPTVTSLHGEPVFSAERIAVDYSLRDAFGGPYLFGLHAVDLVRPRLTIVHHRDGTYNITLPAATKTTNAKPFAVPRIHLSIEDGSAGIVDETRIYAHSRRIAIEGLRLDARLVPTGLSTFTVALALAEDGGKFPLTARGTFDETRGYEVGRLRGRTLALGPLVDYALNSTALHVAGGVLNDIDARVYGLLDRHGTMRRHLGVTANLDHFQPYLGGLTKPLRDGRGALRVYDDGLAIPKVDGSIAGVPVRIAGAIYDLTKPTLRLGITGRGPLSQLLTLSDAGKKLALAGPMAFSLLVEGDATQPTTLAEFASPHLRYGTIPLEGTSGLVALSGPETAILHAGVTYDGITAGARGRVLLQKHTDVELLASVDVPARRLPYAAQLLGPMTVHTTAVVAGTDAALVSRGVLAGDAGAHRLAATFAVDGRGIGSVGPIAIDGPGQRSLYARVALDRPLGGGGALFVSARDLHLQTSGPQPLLPGIALPPLPNVAGTLDADVAASFAGKQFVAGGTAHAYNVVALGYPIDDLTARASFASPQRIAVDAHYRGSLGALAKAAGGTIAARGRADIPISLVADGAKSVLAQIHDARFSGASVAGVPIDGLEATVGVRGKAYDVYGARLRVAGNDVVARGSFGNGGTLEVSAGDVALGSLRALGLPVTRGSVSALAEITGTVASPHVDGGVAASDVRLQAPQVSQLAVSANTGLRYAAGMLTLDDALVRAGPAIASLDGTVGGLRRPGAARYVLDAHIRQADIASLARIAKSPLRYPEGSLDADVRVAGSGTSPSIAGHVAIPEGSLNGLRFRNASVALSGNARSVAARRGRVTVGTSTVDFAGEGSPSEQRFALHAARLELADFNDYFDHGDTLGGNGSIDVAGHNAPAALTTSGRIRLAHTKVRRFDVGDARADWSTSGRTIATSLALGSSAGRISTTGNVTLAATAPLRDALHRTTVSLAAAAGDIDLGTWLPAAGVIAPVAGVVNANATVRGAYPNVIVGAHAELARGRVGSVTIRTATIDARAARGRATITDAVLAIDNLTANGSGSFGLEPRDAIDLTVAARSADVGALAKTLTGKTYDVAGALSTTVHLNGTALHPLASDVLDLDRARYAQFTLPHAHAEVAASQTLARLQRAEIDLPTGRVLANGFAPLRTGASPGIGPASAPLALNVTAEKIDLGQFARLLPKGTQAGGFLDGTVGLGGSLANPSLSGTLALGDGSFVGPQEKSKISSAVAQLTFADRSATLHDASAAVGGGTLALAGRVSVADLNNPAQSASANLQVVSNGAVFNVPNLFRGRVNGTLTVNRVPGTDAVVGGNLSFSSARIATTALLPKTPTAQSSAAPVPVSLALGIAVGDDVRVQGGPVDIGAKGNLQIGGTVSAPTASGELDSTGGTISFYRTFRLQFPSTLTFDPSDGVVPSVDATATTTVDNPPTDVTLSVTGPATQLSVVLGSDPSYSREQILGLLVGAQALGAVSGVQTTTQSGAQQNPFQAAAAGQLGTLLTQNVLEPFSSQLGGAVGLNNLAINYTPGGGVDLGAQKKIFKNINAVFAESFGYPQRQSLGLVDNSSNSTAIQLTFFSQPSSNRFDTFEGSQSLLTSNEAVSGSEPANGSSGFSFSIQRKFR